MKFQFKATNNEVEYEVVTTGLQLCKALEVRRISLKIDSQLVVNQILGEYEARDANMQKYLKKTEELISGFKAVLLKDYLDPRTNRLMHYPNWGIQACKI